MSRKDGLAGATLRWLLVILLVYAGYSSIALAGGLSAATLAAMAAYNRGDFTAAYILLRQAAAAGDPEAQVNLGYMYARGQAVPQSQAEAMRLYRLSADQGDSEGMNAIGYKYQFGTGVVPNIQLAIEWYCRAVFAGNPRAMNNLAILLNSGGYLPRDVPEARLLWEQAAALGKLNAMYNLGNSFLGEPERDPVKAEMWLRRAAEGGQAQAQLILRRAGITDAFPAPINEAAMMAPAPKGVSGHSKVCGAAIA